MAKTETAEYIFTVKEGSPPDSGGDAPTFLMCEPRRNELSCVGENQFLTIELVPGTSIDRAKEVAAILNTNASGIGIVST